MGWAKGKTLKGKRPYKRWGKNPRAVATHQARMLNNASKGEHGGTVLYRSHVRSEGTLHSAFTSRDPLGADTYFDQELTTKYQHSPRTLARKVQLYAHLADGVVPPLIESLQQASVTKRPGHILAGEMVSHFKEQWRSITFIHGELMKVHMMFSATKYYFIEEDNVFGTIRRSCLYRADKAREIMRSEAIELIIWTEKIQLHVLPDH